MEKQRLLLLEDEENLAFSLEFNLSQEGYLVDVAGTLAQARTCLETARYELLILDVMLPDGLGFDLCRELRNRGDVTPIVMLTAKGQSHDIVRGLDAGADNYMTKPFSLDELLARIAAMLRRQAWLDTPQTLSRFHFGPHLVDFDRHEVHANGELVDLTALEVSLLRYFIENQERVVSREELLENVWQVSRHTVTRAVDNFIVRLRRVFEEDQSNPRYFQTVRGVGYRFVVK